ncbi:MAG: hypothetical protein AB7G75_03200 [Candidatus Binatia bacterium]
MKAFYSNETPKGICTPNEGLMIGFIIAFPMTNKVLTPEEQSDLFEKSALVEETIGREVHHHFEQFAEVLEKKVHGT